MNKNSGENEHREHRKRLKAQFFETKGEEMSDYTLLEYLLYYAVPQGDTNPTAHRLIETFGSLDKVLEARVEDLAQVKGMGEHSALYLSSFLPVLKRYRRIKAGDNFDFKDKEKIEQYLRARYTGATEEKAMIMNFDKSGKFINGAFLGSGNADETRFDKRGLARACINGGAYYVILAHNHPSGIVNPSKGDIEALKETSAFLSLINVKTADNVILTVNDILFFSNEKKYAEYL